MKQSGTSWISAVMTHTHWLAKHADAFPEAFLQGLHVGRGEQAVQREGTDPHLCL